MFECRSPGCSCFAPLAVSKRSYVEYCPPHCPQPVASTSVRSAGSGTGSPIVHGSTSAEAVGVGVSVGGDAGTAVRDDREDGEDGVLLAVAEGAAYGCGLHAASAAA